MAVFGCFAKIDLKKKEHNKWTSSGHQNHKF